MYRITGVDLTFATAYPALQFKQVKAEMPPIYSAILSGLEKLVPEYRRVPVEQVDPAAAQAHPQMDMLATV